MTDIREQEMQNRIDSLTLEKENLRYEIDCLKEQIAQLKKMAFGSRTEKTKKILGELEEINLFDEAEVEAKGSAPEPVIEVPAHQRRKKQKGHLEQIITQKYLAGFPEGEEAWAEFRRTGYPRVIPVRTNNSGGTINTDLQVRRLPYPIEESQANGANLTSGIALLRQESANNGGDNGGTRLWWDKNPRF